VRRDRSFEAQAQSGGGVKQEMQASTTEERVLSEAEVLRLSEEAALDLALKASTAQQERDAATEAAQQRHMETVGQRNRQRRQLLAEATPGTGVEARVILPGQSPQPQPGCVVCRGSGWVVSSLTDDQVTQAAATPDDDLYTCGVCFGDGEYCISAACGRHFFCRECIEGTLSAAVEMGQFPSCCPVCSADAGSSTHTERTGVVDAESVSFLAARGVISRALLFRWLKAVRSGGASHLHLRRVCVCALAVHGLRVSLALVYSVSFDSG
jgi:hypothetical protein